MRLSLSTISTVNATLRRGRRGLRRGGLRRDRALGDQAAGRRRREPRPARRARPRRLELHPDRAVVPAARDPGHGGPGRPRGAARGDLRVDRAARRIRAGVRACPERPGGRASAEEAREIVVAGLTRAARPRATRSRRSASSRSIPSQRETAAFVTSLADALALLDEAGLDDVGLMADTYNLAHERLADVVAAVAALHRAPRRRRAGAPETGVRALPGRGRARTEESSPRSASRAGTARSTSRSSRRPRFWSLPVDEAARQAYTAARRLVSRSRTARYSARAEELPFGTVTFLFTDIEGSTRLLHALGPDGYAKALAEHRRILRAAFTSHGGVEVDTQGDAFFVAFATATEAAAAALAGRDGLEPGPIRVRIGLHTGEPTSRRRDTSESTSIGAHGSRRSLTVARSLSHRLDRAFLEAPVRDLGRIGSRTSPAPTRAPSARHGRLPITPHAGRIELPTPATRFLGREYELHRRGLDLARARAAHAHHRRPRWDRQDALRDRARAAPRRRG